MMQSWNQFPVTAHQQPQPTIAPQPSPQTGDQAEHQRLSNEALRQQIEQDNQRLDPGTVDMIAHQYILAGPTALQNVAGRGRAGQANRDAILNRASQIAGTRPGENVQVGFARYRNGMHALQTLENQLGTISGNEQSARGYAEQALAAIRNLRPDNSWAPTNWIRNLAGDTSNDPNLGTWDTARNTFLTEYGKVVAGSPSGAGVLSDSARQEQMAVLRRTTNPQQAAAIIAQMQRDMEIRHSSLQANIQRGYQNLETGHPVSFDASGEMLDERGNVVPVGAPAGGRDDNAGPPILGHPPAPPAGPGGTPPVGPAPQGMDRTTVHMGEDNSTDVSLNTSLTQRVPDPALAGLNEHVQGMLRGGTPDAEIRQYIEDRGVPIGQVPGINDVLAWRQAHPGYQGSYRVDLDKHLVPQSLYRAAMTNFGDSAPGAAVISAGNMVTGQQIPNIVGATGGDAELAQLGINEIRNRHPVGALVGDIGGAALTYGGAQAVGRAGLNAAERIAPSVYARLPAWVRAGSSAAEAEAAAAPYSAEAASQSALAPTATLAPRAIATDAGVGAYESPDNRGEGALVGGLTGVGFRGALNTGARAISPTGGNLAPAYEEGVQPTLGQRMGGAANRVEQAFTSVPGLGDIAQRGARNAAVEQWQLGGFNRALRNLPDEPQLPAAVRAGYGENASAAHNFAQDQFDNAYTRVHQRINVVPTDELTQQLEAIRQDATSSLADPQLSHFNRVLDNSVIRRLDGSNGEPLTGSDLQDMLSKVRTQARNARSSPDPDARELATSLDDISQAIYDNAALHSPPEAMQTLGNINRGYGMLARIETAANRTSGNVGSYTPRALLNAERQQGGLRGRQFLAGNGLMTDYAQAGMQLGDTLPSSGTAERLSAMGTAGGAVGALHFTPAAALPMAAYAADTIATLPGARQAVSWALRPNRPAIRPFTDEIRAQIQARAGIGSTLGAPGVVSLYSAGP